MASDTSSPIKGSGYQTEVDVSSENYHSSPTNIRAMVYECQYKGQWVDVTVNEVWLPLILLITLNSWTVKKLKLFLTENCLPVAGKKTELKTERQFSAKKSFNF